MIHFSSVRFSFTISGDLAYIFFGNLIRKHGSTDACERCGKDSCNRESPQGEKHALKSADVSTITGYDVKTIINVKTKIALRRFTFSVRGLFLTSTVKAIGIWHLL